MPQPGCFDLDEGYARLNECDPLAKLNQLIDWEAFREPLSVLRNPPRKSQAGRKPCDLVLMLQSFDNDGLKTDVNSIYRGALVALKVAQMSSIIFVVIPAEAQGGNVSYTLLQKQWLRSLILAAQGKRLDVIIN